MPTPVPAAFNIIPKPVNLCPGEGAFVLSRETVILVPKGNRAVRDVARYLVDILQPATGFTLTVRGTAGRAATVIDLALTAAGRVLGQEGYTLKVTPRRIVLRAPAAAGLFYGIQTLRQLLPADIFSPYAVTRTPWTVPAVTIQDTPRYAWRGLMLDTARHFFDKAYILKFLDTMALHKLNVFHFHLTEDQGWRLASRKYPKLNTVAAMRTSSPLQGDRNQQDGIPYGPYFFSHDDIREIVAHARQRFITVVPEIEMPGHALAALSAYPELSCTGGPFKPRTAWGIEQDVYCAGKEATFRFLQGVLDEILPLFPSAFVHIGGDECPKERWKQCPACQARIRSEGLKDEHELQSYFVRRMERYLRGKGRRLIGWDEILEGGLADGAAVMSWRGTEGGIAAAKAGHDVVMTPTSHCYFDYYHSEDTSKEPEAIGGNLPVEKVYAYDPTPAELPPARHKHILGVQGNLWSEYLHSWQKVDFMAYPRACALAEVAWTPQESRDFADFSSRLARHVSRLDLLGVRYRPL